MDFGEVGFGQRIYGYTLKIYSKMSTVSINLEPLQRSMGVTQYACIGANIFFLVSAVVSFFASTLDDPFAHFDSQPKWMFMTFCSFSVAAFNIVIAHTLSARFRKIANDDAEPGHEHSRYGNLKATFILSAVLSFALAIATGFLASLWRGTIRENKGFTAPFLLGVLAALIDIAAIFADFWRFMIERKAFIRATSSGAEFGEGEIMI